ncbi:MAG TPA: hypothetical protein VEC14_14515, partial [Reyranellaceae bacterium]|nr:hypothetical protein [Reyranellaceae bacterium]
ANILFSAAKSDGSIRRLMVTLAATGHVLCADAYVAEEARRNLAAKSPNALMFYASLLDRLEIVPTGDADMPPTAASLAEKDRPVLAGAVRARCDVLLTGDKRDFGPFLGQILEGLAIHSPQSLAATLFK